MTDTDVAARRLTAVADGTTTEGRKGIAYLRDHYVPGSVADALEQFAASSS